MSRCACMIAVVSGSACVGGSGESASAASMDDPGRRSGPARIASSFLGEWRLESSVAFDFVPSVPEPGRTPRSRVSFSEMGATRNLLISHGVEGYVDWNTMITGVGPFKAETDRGLTCGQAQSVLMDERTIIMLSAVEGNWIVHSYRTVGDDVLEYCVLRLLEPMGGTPMMRRVYRRG